MKILILRLKFFARFVHTEQLMTIAEKIKKGKRKKVKEKKKEEKKRKKVKKKRRRKKKTDKEKRVSYHCLSNVCAMMPSTKAFYMFCKRT